MLAMTWNIRGLGKDENMCFVKKVVNKHRPSLMFIQETKLSSFDSKVIRSIDGSWLTRGLGVESVGSAGGLITLWNEDLFIAKACIKNSRCIIITGELVKFSKDVAFCNVYASNVESDRIEL
ncbi:hypothetical protein Dsin_004468 [Dipteronia sinensis]|uniref:Endonuclease/exonuclease/phosphatase domain-containing protein n=1 Tax=Dipteronia sinensis TaxID=43782 RepID=A0AAE0AUL4_9ROSI|nr:hypothetical protein Dsin_004468 [Dipteronia sinensis]